MSSVQFEDWTLPELKQFRKKLEQMYVQGVRQGTFKDQMLFFVSSIEIKQRIADLNKAIDARDGTKGRNKKQIRVTTRNRGFR